MRHCRILGRKRRVHIGRFNRLGQYPHRPGDGDTRLIGSPSRDRQAARRRPNGTHRDWIGRYSSPLTEIIDPGLNQRHGYGNTSYSSGETCTAPWEGLAYFLLYATLRLEDRQAIRSLYT
jgi:hypothetical protein